MLMRMIGLCTGVGVRVRFYLLLIILNTHTDFKYGKFNLLEWMHNLGRAWDGFLNLLVGICLNMHTQTCVNHHTHPT